MSLAILTGVFEDRLTVRVVYSDETGTGSEESEPFTVVVGVMFNMDSQWTPVEQSIAGLLSNVLPHRSASNYELKGRRLYQKLRQDPDAEPAKTILTQVHQIAVTRKLQIFTGVVARRGALWGIGKALNRPDITSNSIAFGECLRAVDNYMATLLPRERVLWISDKSREEASLKSALDWQRITQQLDLRKAYPGLNLPEQPPSDISRIVDTIYFGHSNESRALQLADVYCSTIGLALRDYPIAKPFFQIISHQIVNFVGAL